jgi:hypothetical protein
MKKIRLLINSVVFLCAGMLMATAMGSTPYPAYLLVHFTSEAGEGEQIRFSVSTDGYRWNDLNGSRPVMMSDVGDRGVRDPSIIRAASGNKFYILATDLRMANGRGWDAAMHKGSTSMVIFESTDLVTWSAPRLVSIAGNIPGAGCVWAPEAIYDPDAGDYLVYWTTISTRDGIDKPRIYYSRTRDFVTFTPAALYIDRPGKAGLIDTQIVSSQDPKAAFRYYRASGDGEITLEGANSLLGDWVRIGDLRSVGLTGKDVEGPILFRLADSGKWGLWVDQYAKKGGYLALTSHDLSKAENFRLVDPARISLGASKKRHGSILNITAGEYQALLAKWPMTQP